MLLLLLLDVVLEELNIFSHDCAAVAGGVLEAFDFFGFFAPFGGRVMELEGAASSAASSSFSLLLVGGGRGSVLVSPPGPTAGASDDCSGSSLTSAFADADLVD